MDADFADAECSPGRPTRAGGCTPVRGSSTTSTCSPGRPATSPASGTRGFAAPRRPTTTTPTPGPKSSGRWRPRRVRRCPATTTCWPRTSSTTAQRVWLIDYEYSGNNDACFELGNTSTECNFTPEQTEAWTEAYFGTPTRADLARVRLQALCSEYGWSLWGFIQAATSPIDYDFHAWGMHRFDKAEATFRGPDLERPARGRRRWLTGGAEPALPRRDRGHRRGRDRRVGRLPPDQARQDRRAAARAGPPLGRYDVARGRAGRAAAGLGERDPAGAVLGGALRLARGRDRAGHRLPQRRRRHRGPHRGPDGPAEADGGQRRGVRHGVRAGLAGAGPGAVAGDAGRRPARRAVAAGRRQGQPDRPHPVAGQGRPDGRRPGRRDRCGSPASRSRGGGSPRSRPTGAASSATSSSTAPASGPRRWATWSA